VIARHPARRVEGRVQIGLERNFNSQNAEGIIGVI